MYYRIDEKMIKIASRLMDSIRNVDGSNATKAQAYQAVDELKNCVGELRTVNRMVGEVDSGALMGIAFIMQLMACMKAADELHYLDGDDISSFGDEDMMRIIRHIVGEWIANELEDLFREGEPV